MGRRRDEDDDDYDRPIRRRRDEDDEEDDRPRRRSRRDEDEDEDEDDRPRKRRRRGDDGPFDETFSSTPVPLLVVFGVFCGCIAFCMSLLVLITGKDPLAKKNGQICLLASVGGLFFWIFVRVGLLMLRIW